MNVVHVVSRRLLAEVVGEAGESHEESAELGEEGTHKGDGAHGEDEIHIHGETAILFFVVMLVVGLFVKHFLKWVPLPYSGLLLVSCGQ